MYNRVSGKWLVVAAWFIPLVQSLAAIPVLEPATIKPDTMRDFYLKNLPALKDYQPWRISRYPYTPPRLAPGEGLVLVDLKGSGYITHIWWTGRWQREWVQFYFDGETTPSIEGFCAELFTNETVAEPINRLPVPLNVLPTDGRNCYIPMPFHTSVKVVLVNRAETAIEDTYFIFDGIFRSSETIPDCTLKYSRKSSISIPERGRNRRLIRLAMKNLTILLSVSPRPWQTKLNWSRVRNRNCSRFMERQWWSVLIWKSIIPTIFKCGLNMKVPTPGPSIVRSANSSGS